MLAVLPGPLTGLIKDSLWQCLFSRKLRKFNTSGIRTKVLRAQLFSDLPLEPSPLPKLEELKNTSLPFLDLFDLINVRDVDVWPIGHFQSIHFCLIICSTAAICSSAGLVAHRIPRHFYTFALQVVSCFHDLIGLLLSQLAVSVSLWDL